MLLLEKDILSTNPTVCFVNAEYLRYLRKYDHRVSVKNNRKFVALAIIINNFIYAVPLTSKTNEQRVAEGKKPRRRDLITPIMNEGIEIADLLYSNMIPVDENLITKIIINSETDTYLANEERFIRKNWLEINEKAVNVYRKRYDTEHRDYQFLTWICCDYKALEKAYNEYAILQNNH